LAHITGGGIAENVNRIMPPTLDARIDASLLKVQPIFKKIREVGNVSDQEMLRTFNMGVGMVVVVDTHHVHETQELIKYAGGESYIIGEIVEGKQAVGLEGKLAL
ncbi:MAG: AIR synthase-related protein, partial [Candidatus Binatia bacterium]